MNEWMNEWMNSQNKVCLWVINKDVIHTSNACYSHNELINKNIKISYVTYVLIQYTLGSNLLKTKFLLI